MEERCSLTNSQVSRCRMCKLGLSSKSIKLHRDLGIIAGVSQRMPVQDKQLTVAALHVGGQIQLGLVVSLQVQLSQLSMGPINVEMVGLPADKVRLSHKRELRVVAETLHFVLSVQLLAGVLVLDQQVLFKHVGHLDGGCVAVGAVFEDPDGRTKLGKEHVHLVTVETRVRVATVGLEVFERHLRVVRRCGRNGLK